MSHDGPRGLMAACPLSWCRQRALVDLKQGCCLGSVSSPVADASVWHDCVCVHVGAQM